MDRHNPPKRPDKQVDSELGKIIYEIEKPLWLGYDLTNEQWAEVWKGGQDIWGLREDMWRGVLKSDEPFQPLISYLNTYLTGERPLLKGDFYDLLRFQGGLDESIGRYNGSVSQNARYANSLMMALIEWKMKQSEERDTILEFHAVMRGLLTAVSRGHVCETVLSESYALCAAKLRKYGNRVPSFEDALESAREGIKPFKKVNQLRDKV